MIGGNKRALVQIKKTEKNEYGESESTWIDAFYLTGWLDMLSGSASIANYSAMIQESTHVFMTDYQSLEALTDDYKWDSIEFEKNYIVDDPTSESVIQVTQNNARMIVDGVVYELTMIDDPMELHEHIEIYLKYVGGGISGGKVFG